MPIIYEYPIKFNSEQFQALSNEQRVEHILEWRKEINVKDIIKIMDIPRKVFYDMKNELGIPDMDKKLVKRNVVPKNVLVSNEKLNETDKQQSHQPIKDMAELMKIAGTNNSDDAKKKIEEDMKKVEELSRNQMSDVEFGEGMHFKYRKNLSAETLARRLRKLADQIDGENYFFECFIEIKELPEEDRM
jgi:hypothetical protein